MTHTVEEIAGETIREPEQFRREIVEACRPIVLRGLVRNWPMVEAGRGSPAAFRQYLAEFDAGQQTEAFFGEPQIAGKYYYTDDLKGFNFERRKMQFGEALDAIVANLDRPGAQSVYVGSLPMAAYLPGLAAQNPMPVLSAAIGPRIWLGHASNVSPHYDTLDNIACVAAASGASRSMRRI